MWKRRQEGPVGSGFVGSAEAIVQIVERTQAVIHFSPEGNVIAANDIFLKALGYTLDEVVGQHHRMFVQRRYRETQAYKDFWDHLRAGEFFTDEFPRVTKEDKVIWISATYAPVFDQQGNVVQITKIASEITKQREAINALSAGLRALSDGNLNCRVNVAPDDRMAEVATSFNATAENVSNLIRRVKHVAELIDGMAQRISRNSEDLSRRTETQAATLEQTAAAVDQLSANSKSGSSYADEVGTEARSMRAAAGQSSRVVEDVTAAMKRIEQSSDAISDIISVIDDIAFQTNLLALNAGVEAARAGEAGRGFAVVASEVRQLAQRSADSAREIKTLIGQSTDHVQDGAELVAKASNDFDTIFKGVEGIGERIGVVVSGLQEQTSTLLEVNSAVSQLDRVTQQNAAMVGETAALAADLLANSTSLSDAVSVFDVSAEEDPYQSAAVA